jgi:hypothetical protein
VLFCKVFDEEISIIQEHPPEVSTGSDEEDPNDVEEDVHEPESDSEAGVGLKLVTKVRMVILACLQIIVCKCFIFNLYLVL